MSFLKRIYLVFVCVVILLFSTFGVFGASEGGSIGITFNDLLDMGYILDDEGNAYMPSGYFDPLMSFGTMLATEPNFPNEHPNNIDWSATPQFIQDVINLGYDNLEEHSSNYKMPLVIVVIRDGLYHCYVGVNVAFGTNLGSGSNRICVTNYFFEDSFNFTKGYCYYGVFNPRLEAWTTPFYTLSSTAWGDSGIVRYLTVGLFLPEDAYDVYFYGGNGAAPRNVGSISFPLFSDYETYDDFQFWSFVNAPTYFQNMSSRWFFNDTSYPYLYCDFFKPSYYGVISDEPLGELSDAEDDLLGNYDSDDLDSDLQVNLDFKSFTLIFELMDSFLNANSIIFSAVITLLSLGIIALILNR